MISKHPEALYQFETGKRTIEGDSDRCAWAIVFKSGICYCGGSYRTALRHILEYMEAGLGDSCSLYYEWDMFDPEYGTRIHGFEFSENVYMTTQGDLVREK